MTSRAAVLSAFHQPLDLRRYPTPATLDPGEALVVMKAAQ